MQKTHKLNIFLRQPEESHSFTKAVRNGATSTTEPLSSDCPRQIPSDSRRCYSRTGLPVAVRS